MYYKSVPLIPKYPHAGFNSKARKLELFIIDSYLKNLVGNNENCMGTGEFPSSALYNYYIIESSRESTRISNNHKKNLSAFIGLVLEPFNQRPVDVGKRQVDRRKGIERRKHLTKI